MSVKVSTYAGRIGWLARKYIPNVTGRAYLKFQYIRRKRLPKIISIIFMTALIW